MSRRLLIRVFLCLVALGIGFLTIPFSSSLLPSEKVFADRPRVKIPDLQPGQFAFVANPTWENGEFLFVRRPNGKLDVWHTLRRDGQHVLPDLHWWRPGMPCNNFGPDFDKGIIQCFDPELYPWAKQNFIWSLDGKSLTKRVDDMDSATGFEEFGDYVLGKKKG